MVEGPGCKLKGEKLRPRIRGQTVRSVGGDAVTKHAKKVKQDGAPASPFHQLIGRTIIDVQTLGKELFIFFEGLELCLMVHFLMDGSVRFSGQSLESNVSRDMAAPTLALHLTKEKVTFNKSAMQILSTSECRAKISKLRDLDICASGFCPRRAVELILAQSGRMACDVLLDQEILPGVGNIIKNEALFDSGIKPDTKIGDLSEAHVSHLVKMTRDFSMIFYKCRKEGKSLDRYLKIYRKSECRQCGGKAVTTRMGDSSARLTSFCPHCQNNNLKHTQRCLPAKNSLLSWVSQADPSSSTQGTHWVCSVCTLLNDSQRTSCQVCLTPRATANHHQPSMNCPTPEQLTNIHELSMKSAGFPGQQNSNQKVTVSQTPQECSVLRVRTSLVDSSQDRKQCLKRRLEDDDVCMPPSKRVHSQSHLSSRIISELTSAGQSNTAATPPLSLTVNAAQTPSSKRVVPARSNASGPASRGPLRETCQPQAARPPTCDRHKRPCTIRQVHKAGENHGRVFWSCTGRTGSARCNFFMWADEGFPQCPDHGKRSVLRTVLKQGTNNGRKFFACSLDKNKQCGFFQWADGY